MKIPVRTIGILILVFGMACSLCHADLESAKDLFTQKDYASAKAEFQNVFNNSTGTEHIDALMHMMKCDYFTKDHESLETLYNAHINETSDTPFYPAISFIYANSLKDHKEDYDAALAIYEIIPRDYPESAFAAPGSLLKIGEIKLIQGKPEEALASYNQILEEYPESAYHAAAMEGIVKSYAEMKDREALLNALDEMYEAHPTNRATARAGLEAGYYFARTERNRREAIDQFRKVIDSFPDFKQVAEAKVRYADLIPRNDIYDSIKVYKDVLANHNHISGNMELWTKCELAFAYLLKSENEKAIPLLENVLSNQDNPEKYLNKAQRLLTAVNDPDSIEAYEVNFDLAFRHRDHMSHFDIADKHYYRIIKLYETGTLTNLLNNPGIDSEKKADWLYKLSIAYFFTTKFRESEKTAKIILEKYPETGETAAHAEFLLAFLDAYSCNYEEAITKYLNILEKYPNLSFDTRILKEIAKCHVHLGNKEDALVTLDGLAWVYPYHINGIQSIDYIGFLLKGDKELQKKYYASALKDSKNQIARLLKDNLETDSYRNKFYNVLNAIKIAQSEKPIIKQDQDFEEILISMK